MSFAIQISVLKHWMKTQNPPVRAEDLASKVRVSINTIQRALRGESISVLTLLALCQATGLTEDELLGKARHRESKREAVS